MKIIHYPLLVCLLVAIGCNNDPTSGRQGGNSGNSGSGSNAFASTDLFGDWIGKAIPSDPAAEAFLIYVRCDNLGDPFDGAASTGELWDLQNSLLFSSVSEAGATTLRLEQTGEDLAKLEILGSLSEGRNQINGTFQCWRNGAQVDQGDVELHLSLGAAQFTVADQLAGSWAGDATHVSGRSKQMTLEIDSDGSVIGGKGARREFLAYGPNTGIFQFSESSVGRLDDIVIESADGTEQTLAFALVSAEGDLMEGPASDTEYGNRIVVRLSRQP
ncbi:MAG: hypothetical protein DWQ01_20995 [Planctomycetota bacterium]|nr:MAG: hypothetical protein DWQ01_20995 [Planctomycetota bacterium]